MTIYKLYLKSELKASVSNRRIKHYFDQTEKPAAKGKGKNDGKGAKGKGKAK